MKRRKIKQERKRQKKGCDKGKKCKKKEEKDKKCKEEETGGRGEKRTKIAE